MDSLKIELNIALAPGSAVANELTRWSQAIARHNTDTRVMLGEEALRLSDAPHLTLYQVPIRLADVDTFATTLQRIAQNETSYELTATGLVYNEGERSLEVGYETPARLASLQMNVINSANKLRGNLLLEKDPAGNDVSLFLDAEGELGDNIRAYGYAEVNGLFRPHATLNWFGPETDFDITAEQDRPYAHASGIYDTLIISALGSHGRCAQQLASYRLGD